MTVVRPEGWCKFDKILKNNKEQRCPQEITFYATGYVAIFLSAALARQVPLCNNKKNKYIQNDKVIKNFCCLSSFRALNVPKFPSQW